ncbi:hypothetical protein RE428_44470 [Marinobacter nanhaiticus D15-8W]|uniref:DUF3530 family protein n=1 Tax=Marinobacter nanhaiticus D15-8W TaxID=626887 RepID=N6W685_9GAMM|nr:DUF3530 family protein [Marinobacter nanhaiticus]ENO15714.1 DUF3530 family protein [Marinobacter nanhaiticus D15-8W]BES73429.1 hypothetical protein RE428_44470 [Marinobacter nanhaiticus D15-8W]
MVQRIKTAVRVIWIILSMGAASGLVAQPSNVSNASGEASDQSAPDGEAAAESKDRPFISTGLNSEALAAQRPEQAVWLDTGSHGRALGLLERETVAPAKGAVLILAGEGQSADAELAGALRQPLAAAGWATMSLGLELPPYPIVRARSLPPESDAPEPPEEAPASGNDDDPEEPPADSGSIMIDVMDKVDLDQLRQDYREKLDTQVGEAVSHLRGQGYQRVALVGIGRGAAPMARLAMNGIGKAQGEPQALIWVAPILESAALETLGGAGAADLRILDLESGRVSNALAGTRQSTLRRAGFRGYDRQQVAMAPRPTSMDARQVASRISAWLQRQFFPEP